MSPPSRRPRASRCTLLDRERPGAALGGLHDGRLDHAAARPTDDRLG
jgi:hypothetical protein